MKLTKKELSSVMLQVAEHLVMMFIGLCILALAIMVIHLRTFGIDASQLDNQTLSAIAGVYLGIVWAAYMLIMILQMIVSAFRKPHSPEVVATGD